MTIYPDAPARPVLQIAMPRAPRISAAGETAHVVARCNNREFCFIAGRTSMVKGTLLRVLKIGHSLRRDRQEAIMLVEQSRPGRRGNRAQQN